MPKNWERREPKKIDIEQLIITGMIISSEFLREAVNIVRPNLFRTKMASQISLWCIEYFQSYQEAPGQTIQAIYNRKKDLVEYEDSIELIEEFLGTISKKYASGATQINADHLIDEAELYFRIQAARQTAETVLNQLDDERIDDAEIQMATHNRPSRTAHIGIDPIGDVEKTAYRLHEQKDTLFGFPGDLGNMIDPFQKGHLWAVLAPQKVGKTWWLMQIAIWAMYKGLNILFASMEMSEEQMTRRIYHNLTMLPNKKWAGEILIPKFDCLDNQLGACILEQRKSDSDYVLIDPKTYERPDFIDVPDEYVMCDACRRYAPDRQHYKMATWYTQQEFEELKPSIAIAKIQKLTQHYFRGNQFKLIEFPTGRATMDDLRNALRKFELYEGFSPHVIITDYADKFKAESGTQDKRHQLESIWADHKALAQEHHALVFTASQSNTIRTGKYVRQGDWAESIEKISLVDGALALNQTPEDKRQGIMRVSSIAARHDEFDLLGEAIVLQQFKVGKPYLDSYFQPFDTTRKRRK